MRWLTNSMFAFWYLSCRVVYSGILSIGSHLLSLLLESNLQGEKRIELANKWIRELRGSKMILNLIMNVL